MMDSNLEAAAIAAAVTVLVKIGDVYWKRFGMTAKAATDERAQLSLDQQAFVNNVMEQLRAHQAQLEACTRQHLECEKKSASLEARIMMLEERNE